jgi:hypothetical protein
MPKKIRWPEGYVAPSWLPDWKNIESYSKIPSWVRPDEMHLYFAWQFLRRNYKYQDIYAGWREVFERVDIHLNNRKPGVKSNHVIGNYGYCQRKGITAYPRGERKESFSESIKNTTGLFLMAGLLAAPDNDDFIMPRITLGANVYRPAWYEKPDNENLRLIQVDLRFPIDPQIKRAVTQLKEDQFEEIGSVLRPTHKNRDSAALIRYLRTLDADAVGARTCEIAELLHPTKSRYEQTSPPYRTEKKGSHSPAQKAVDEDRKEAYKLRDSDWRTLID